MLQDKVIEAKTAEITKYREENNALQLKVETLEHNIRRHQQDAADAAAKVFQNCAFLFIL